MSLDLHAVADALREKFADVDAPSGTMGGTTIRGSSVGIETVNVTPFIGVNLPEGEVESEPQGYRRIQHDFAVYFLFNAALRDKPRNDAVMLQWLGPLLDCLETENKLDLGAETGWNVLKSRILSWEPGQYPVGTDLYHAWHFTVRVWTSDTFTVTP